MVKKTELRDVWARAEYVVRTNLIPLALMIVSPPAVQLVWVICAHHNGSVLSALSTPVSEIWGQYPIASLEALKMAGAFLALQLTLLVVIPAEKFRAIPTPMGNRPEYRLNGVASFFVTHGLLAYLHMRGVIRMGALFDGFGALLASLNIIALVVTVLLYIRGLVAPTNSDSGVSGHGVIWDMWQGTELHPEICGVSLKQLINCRFAMMGWSVAVVAFAMKQYEMFGYVSNSAVVSAGLQMIYIFKFFWWESGYFNSVDIIHDRFGFYIFWGCSAFLPSIYLVPSLYLAAHPIDLPQLRAYSIFAVGVACVCANYDTDRQRQRFRATGGREKVWGASPHIVHARYKTGDGKMRDSILLASGWWGVARHINYAFEIGLALCWSLPAGASGVLPYLYVTFLTILLTDRAYRDELRCSAKYGAYYDEYCTLVPYRLLPGIY